jgi:hypothetical protein
MVKLGEAEREKSGAAEEDGEGVSARAVVIDPARRIKRRTFFILPPRVSD